MSVESTAHLVAYLGRIGMAERRRRIPNEQPSTLIEAAFATQFVSFVHGWRAELEPLLRDLPQLIAQAVRRDSVRMDDTPEGTRVRSAINRARTTANRIASVARRAGQQASDHQKRQLQRQLKAGLGVDVPLDDRKVPTMIERFVERNVSSIEQLEGDTLGKVQDIILRAFDRGTPADEVAAEISEQFGIAERAARNLASNQLTKLSAQVRRGRHTEIGIATFRWRNSPAHIARGVVRPSHAVKHDKIFPYEGSRAPSFFPGEERNCGCLAFPVLDEIRGKAAELAGKGVNRRASRLDAKENEMRIAIAGGPRCGKTTFSETLGDARHTDDLIPLGWSEASDAIATWFDEPDPWIVEGVAVPRALRKWLAAHPEGKPCDVVYALFVPHVPLTKGQETMFKGCLKTWNEIVDELRRRGVEIR